MSRTPLALLLLAITFFAAKDALAFDKQGSAHGGEVGDEPGHNDEFNVSGGLMMGVSIINPTYAARPDNTGLALMRYAGHADVDLIGRKLSIPIDINMFTDRTRKGLKVFSPTELDLIGGVTTTNSLTKGADVELGVRAEHDRPIDQGDFSQTYADVRARLLYSLGDVWPSLKRDLVDGDISGYATLGWFAINPTYAARPDNTGLALFRYVGHVELSVWKDHLSLGLDGTFFSDKNEKDIVKPSELDVTYETILRSDPFELHIAYERDMPIDRGGLVQHFLYAVLVYSFDLRHDVLEPLEKRGQILSP